MTSEACVYQLKVAGEVCPLILIGMLLRPSCHFMSMFRTALLVGSGGFWCNSGAILVCSGEGLAGSGEFW